MKKPKPKKAEAVLVPQFEKGQIVAATNMGQLIITDIHGTMWQVDANNGVATRVEFK